jgi:hypothetical protein
MRTILGGVKVSDLKAAEKLCQEPAVDSKACKQHRMYQLVLLSARSDMVSYTMTGIGQEKRLP